MMTKEECIKRLKEARYTIQPYYYINEAIDYAIKELQNPPLKFEELKEKTWVWDNNWKQYFEICEIYPETNEFDVLIHQNRINKQRYEPIKFEENRFYQREVNDYE